MSKLKSVTSFVDLKGSIAHVNLKGQVTHVNLQLTNLYLNPDSLDRLFTDSFSYTDVFSYDIDKRADDPVYMSELHVFDLSKSLTDSVGFTENVDVLRTFGRNFTDTATMSDTTSVSFSGSYNETVSVAEILNYAMDKALSDITTMSDSSVLEPNLGKADSVSMAEVFSKVVSFQRSFNDTISLDDRTSLADPLATDVSGSKTNIVSIADVLTYDWAKARVDTFGVVENHAIDFTPGGFTDSFSFADNETISTNLSKSDSFGVNDTEVVDTALGKEETVSFTDSETLSTTLGKSDSVSTSDVEVLAVSLSKSDTTTISETHIYSFGKSAQDSATITESISILNANRQSALNASALNSNTLN